MSTYTIHDDPPSITCHRCGLTSQHPLDVQHHYCGACHHFHTDEVSTAVWRYTFEQRVRWAGDGQVWVIVARRWVERQLLGPYAEYYVQREGNRREWGWIVEADLDRLDDA